MTCMGCAAHVESVLASLPQVSKAHVDLQHGTANLEVEALVSDRELQTAFAGSRYGVQSTLSGDTATKNSLSTFWPLILIFTFLTSISSWTSWTGDSWNLMLWMRHFMGGFFLIFSFFKLLDIQGFARSYQKYDLLAKLWPAYGVVYPFIELALGWAFISGIWPEVTAWTTLCIMGFSSIGVIRSVVRKEPIACACLGSSFELPMTTVTIVEDLMMVAMAGAMLTPWI